MKGNLVDFMFDLVASKCPIAVNTEGIKFRLTVPTDNPSITISPFNMLLTKVVFDGYPNAECQYETKSFWLFTSTAG